MVEMIPHFEFVNRLAALQKSLSEIGGDMCLENQVYALKKALSDVISMIGSVELDYSKHDHEV